MSTGFPSAPKSGRWARSARRRSSGSAGTRSPTASAASAATTEGPPEIVRIATAPSRGGRLPCASSVTIASNSSSVSSTTTMPAAAKAARYVSQAPGERAGVGPGGPPPRLGPPALEGDDRLRAREPPGGRDEGPAVPDPLDEEPHHARVGIVGEPGETLREPEVGLIADREELGDAERSLAHLAEEEPAVGSAL